MKSPVSRIDEPRRWTYLVAAVPFVLTAIYGGHAGAAVPYLVAGVLCAVQFFFPTALAWWLVFACYVAASLFYFYSLFADFYRLGRGLGAQVLTDISDAVVFLVWVALLLLITWLLWRMRAARQAASE